MKLRIRDNTIRLRLTQPEVERLGRTGRVEAFTRFGQGEAYTLVYALQVSEDVEGLRAEWNNGNLTVLMPADQAAVWTATGVAEGPVGYEGRQPVGAEVLHVVVEKDFKCLDATRDPAEDAGAYPHPRKAGRVC